MVDVVQLLINLITSESSETAYAELPAEPERPVSLISEAGGPPSDSETPDHIHTHDVQIDTWGTTKAEAFDSIAAIRDLILSAPRLHSNRAEGVVTFTSAGVPSWEPDPDFPNEAGRPGPRYVMAATVIAHT